MESAMEIQNDGGSVATVGNVSYAATHGTGMDAALAICARRLLGGPTGEQCIQEALVSLTGFFRYRPCRVGPDRILSCEDFRGRWVACAKPGGCADCNEAVTT